MRACLAALTAAALTAGCATAGPESPARPVDRPPATATRPPPEAIVHPVTAAELGATWRPECPVGPDGLRRVELGYLGFDGAIHRGNLVVASDVVDDVVAIFADLVRLRYPVERMRTVDHYSGAQDEASMRDNNTSAFNCRRMPGGTDWSEHAYGRAVDLNPLVNPYLGPGGDLQPATARKYLDRTRDDLGLLHAGDAAVTAFTGRGWIWGGTWRDPVDYQHFEAG